MAELDAAVAINAARQVQVCMRNFLRRGISCTALCIAKALYANKLLTQQQGVQVVSLRVSDHSVLAAVATPIQHC